MRVFFRRSMNKGSYWHGMRLKRFGLFRELSDRYAKNSRLRIIDIGGVPAFWDNMGMAGDERYSIDCFNVMAQESRFKNISCFVGDGTELRGVKDNEYDIAFSQSVIEHVGPRANHAKMANEIKRVAPKYFIQTPNYYFPVEPHIRLPFFQFLPLGLRAALAVIIKGKSFRNYAKVKSAVAGVNLLTRAELERLFPDGKIEEEKLMGLVKSFMVHNL